MKARVFHAFFLGFLEFWNEVLEIQLMTIRSPRGPNFLGFFERFIYGPSEIFLFLRQHGEGFGMKR